jgi:hypothetical protein
MSAFPACRTSSPATAISARRSRIQPGADPANQGFKVQDLSLPNGVDDSRSVRRRSALDTVNYFAHKDKSDSVAAMNTFYERAYSRPLAAGARGVQY